jgi:hypothetical protein
VLLAIIIFGLALAALLLVVGRDEITYHRGWKDGYKQGQTDLRREERAKVQAGLQSIGMDRDLCV